MPIPNQAAYDGLGTRMRVMPSGAYPGFPAGLVQGGDTHLQTPQYQINPGGRAVRGGMTREYQHFTGPGWFGPDHDTHTTGIDELNRSQVAANQEQFVFNLPVVFRFPPNIGKVATATANWADAAVPTVAATDNTTGAAVSIRLPRTRSGDPNVRTGATIPYITDTAGLHWAVSDYMDDKVGMVKLWSLTVGAIPTGWEVLSLVTNGQYLRLHKTTAGTTGGNASHNHLVSGNTVAEAAHTHGTSAVTATQPSHDHGGLTGTRAPAISGSLTAATINLSTLQTDNDGSGTTTGGSHAHGITRTSGTAAAGAGVGVVTSVTSPSDTESAHQHNTPSHQHNFSTWSSVGSHTHGTSSLTVASHDHAITGATPAITVSGTTDAGSSHLHSVSITSATANNDPLFYDLIPIIRVA